MTMVEKDKQDEALEALFSAGRSNRPVPSDDFMARLVADAEAAVPQPIAALAPRSGTAWFGGLRGFFTASGLSGAAALGVWIGFLMPDLVSTFSPATEEAVGLYTFLPGADITALADLSE